MLDPRDFKLPAAPADFKFELSYVGARYKITEPVDFSTGQVRAYDAKRAVFDILYEDKDEEEVDFLELGDILIMVKEFGDKDDHKGLTRAEVIAKMGEEALIAAVAEEATTSHGRTSYGEDRPQRRVTFDDDVHPCAQVGKKDVPFSSSL
jgi:hypothetical protein